MATKQLLFGKITIGTLFTETLGVNQFIRIDGNTTNSSDQITGIVDNADSFFGVAELKVGMKLISSGPFPTQVTITNIDGTTLTVSGNAASSTTGTMMRVDPGPGQAFIESGSLSKPNGQSEFTANSITGSNDSEYVEGDLKWAGMVPIARTGSTSTERLAQFAQFEIYDVQSRPSTNQVNFFMTSSGGNMNGFGEYNGWYSNTTVASIYQVGSENYAGPTFDSSEVGLTDTYGFGPGQIVASNLLESVITASDSPFPFSGSAQITGSLGLTGSQEIRLNSNENFLIKNQLQPSQSLFEIDNEGVAVFRAREGSDGIPTAIVGALYFTTSSAFIALN